jgi:hypothetical protein
LALELIDRAHSRPRWESFHKRCPLCIIMRSNKQNVVSPKSVLPALFVAPGGSRLQEMLNHHTKLFNFFWRLALISSVLNRREPQASTIEQSVAIEPLISVLSTNLILRTSMCTRPRQAAD